jgi:lysyl-tRNA synthetase class 2
MMRPSPWWRPDVFAARRPALAARGRLAAAIRADFAAAGLVEVDTPALQVSPGNETHISAFATAVLGDPPLPMYLHSSPEFACKKLLAAGAGDLFTFAHAFRNRERGRLHHPEFTMLEWYRVDGSLDLLMRDVAGILRRAGEIAQDGLFRYREAAVEAAAEPEILTVVEAFRRHAALDLEPLLPDEPDAVARLADATRARGLRVAADDTWSDLFSKLVTALVEPKLGHGRATFLTRYPASEAALARLCPDDPRFADRFELYVCAVELANAFHELADPAEQRRRFMQAEAERARIYGETYPIDEDFLAALEIMPETCGIALGFDRLVMLATGAEHIEDVLWAPVA